MKKHLALKILVSLLPAALFTQNWAWMTGNKIIGIAFLVLWALLIWSVSKVQDKNKVLHDLFRASEIGFFLLPISALVLTFLVGSKTVGSTSGAEQAGAAIGTAIGGVFAVGIGFVVGFFGGIIMHLLGSKYGKRIVKPSEGETTKPNWFDQHKFLTSVLVLIILGIIAGASGNKDPEQATTQDQTSTTSVATSDAVKTPPAEVKPQEPAPVEVVKASVSEDIIGSPVADVTIKNISAKEVDGIKVAIKTFNNFGEPVNGLLTDNVFKGISQEKLTPNASKEMSWTLYNHDTTTKIEAAPYYIHFTDGSTWGADDSGQ